MNEVFSFLANNTAALTAVLVVFSLLVGSFLNVVILRLPIMMFREWKQECEQTELPAHPALNDLSQPYNLVKPDSHCPKCQAPVKAWQNIPVISWLFLRGKYAGGCTKIVLRYSLVEIVTAVLSVVLLVKFSWGWPLLAMLAFTWLLIAMSVIDIDHQILPDVLTLSLLWLGLLANSQGLFTNLHDAVYGAALGYGVLWSVDRKSTRLNSSHV